MKKLLVSALIVSSLLIIPAKAEAANGRCPQYEHLLAANNLPVSTFSHIMWRESNCKPWVRNRHSGATGLLQIHPINRVWLSRQLGTTVTMSWLTKPSNNVRAASVLYRSFGLRPWR